jgi:hypothetical protein
MEEKTNTALNFIKVAKEWAWVGTTLIMIGTYIATTAVNNYKSKEANKSVIDTLAKQGVQNKAILVWMKGIDGKIKSVTDENTITKSSVTTLQGAYYVLDRSYVRTLEKTLKANEELSKYKDEKIEALQEALKKNN